MKKEIPTGLCLYSAGGESWWGGEDTAQLAFDLFDFGNLAWSGLDFFDLGNLARGWGDCDEGAGEVANLSGEGAAIGEAVGGFCFCDLHVDFLSGGDFIGRPVDYSADWHGELGGGKYSWADAPLDLVGVDLCFCV